MGGLTWCYHVLSLGLKFMKEPCYEVFNQFLCIHFDESQKILASPTVEAKDKTSYKQDMMAIL